MRYHYGDICLYLDNEKQDCTIKSVEDDRFDMDKVEIEADDFIVWSVMPQHTIRKGMVQIQNSKKFLLRKNYSYINNISF